MLATSMNRAFIINEKKTKEFFQAMRKTVPTKEFWEDCKRSAESIDMEKLLELYDQ